MSFKIYTKTGDKGETSIWGGKRLPKDHLKIEAYGTVDELNSWMGVVRDHTRHEETRQFLVNIQRQLFTIGTVLASENGKLPKDFQSIDETHIIALEKAIDTLDVELEPLKNFILSGGTPANSFCHVARCVCRRAERIVVALSRTEEINELIIQYLNRLSDYLFTLCRYISKENQSEEIKWV